MCWEFIQHIATNTYQHVEDLAPVHFAPSGRSGALGLQSALRFAGLLTQGGTVPGTVSKVSQYMSFQQLSDTEPWYPLLCIVWFSRLTWTMHMDNGMPRYTIHQDGANSCYWYHLISLMPMLRVFYLSLRRFLWENTLNLICQTMNCRSMVTHCHSWSLKIVLVVVQSIPKMRVLYGFNGFVMALWQLDWIWKTWTWQHVTWQFWTYILASQPNSLE